MAKGIALFASKAAQKAVAKSVARSEREENAKAEIARLKGMLDEALYSLETDDYEEQQAVAFSISVRLANSPI